MGLLRSTTSNPALTRTLPSSYFRVSKTSISSALPLSLTSAVVRSRTTGPFFQNRRLWGWSRRDSEPSWQSHEDPLLRRLKRIEKRYVLKRAHILRRYAWLHHRLSQDFRHKIHHHDHHSRHPWSLWGCGWRGFRTNYATEPGKSNNDSRIKPEDSTDKKQSWEDQEAADEFEQMRREIEKDPYYFLFGKSNEWLSYQPRHHQSWSSFIHSFFGSNEPEDKAPGNHQQDLSSQPETGSRKKNNQENESESVSETRTVKAEESPPLADASNVPQATRFDPISGRMVSASPQESTPTLPANTEIPVKKYSISRNAPGDLAGSSNKPPAKSQETPNSAIMTSEREKNDALQMPAPAEDMETLGPSSLDGNGIPNDVESSSSPPSQQYDVFSTPETEIYEPTLSSKDYPLEETKQDDVDLLRASDVRAAFFSKNTKEDQEAEKQAQRGILDREFDTYEDPERDLNIQDVRRATGHLHSSLPSTTSETISSVVSVRGVLPTETHATDDLANEIRKIYEESYGKITSEHRQQSENEGASESTPQSQHSSSQDTEHAKIISNSELDDAFNRVTQLSISLGRVIEELHNATSLLEKERLQEAASSSATYRVLAYDSSSLQIAIAETGSTFNSPEAPLHPTDVLSRLNNPAKFLPYFSQMQADGYEIVSGGGDILVFKKVRRNGSTTTSMSSEPIPTGWNEISSSPAAKEASVEDSTSSAKTTVETSQARTSSQAHQPLNSPDGARMVRRQETVYTGGPPNWSPYPPQPPPPPPPPFPTNNLSTSQQSEPNTKPSPDDKPSSSSRSQFRENVFFLVIGAASIYAADVVYEYFRTGGEDGRGPEGFTTFEMERRKR